MIKKYPNRPLPRKIIPPINLEDFKITDEPATSNIPQFSPGKKIFAKNFAKPNSCAYICNRLAAQVKI